jgi:TonB-dependent receptor
MKNLLRLLCALCALAATTHTARADDAPAPSALAVVTGRVLDADSNLYLKNAEVRLAGTSDIVYTEDGGAYRIEVPAGPVTLTVSYANLQTVTRALTATAGADNTADFELQPLLLDRAAIAAITTGGAAAGTAADSNIVLLERFTVREERTGQAKVLMEQRAAENVKTIISTDQFGELTQGSVGEFMKYMPGITIDNDDEGETAFVRVGGLDPKYAGFSLDGVTLASATENSTRANHFSQMSITAIESIEFNQTLLARMPANTPAGRFELRTRYAFNRRKPSISFDFGLDGTGNTIELGRSYMPDNQKRMRTYLGGRVSYGGAFLNRTLGIEASVSRYQQYRNDQRHEIQYTYPVPPHTDYASGEFSNPNPGVTFVERNGNLEALQGPTIKRLTWLDGPRIKTSEAANLSLDYKLTPHLTLALRSQYTYNENEYFNIYYRLTAENRDGGNTVNTDAPAPGVALASTLTRWVANPTIYGSTPALETVLTEAASFRVTRDTNYLFSPRINYKKDSLEINFRGAYSYSRGNYNDGDRGRFRSVPNRLGGLGWIAERPSTDSPTWTLTQTAGSLWTEPQNLSRTNTYLMGAYYDDPHFVKNTQASGYLDLTYAMRVLGHPVTFRAGGALLNSDYSRRRTQKNFSYIGPEGLQMAASFPFADNYVFNVDLGGKSGNINEQNWPVIDQNTLWSIFKAHPEWFTSDSIDNTRNPLINRNDLTERISALYAEATTRAGKFQFNLGLRAERTDTEVLFTRMRSQQEIDIAKKFASPEEIDTGRFATDTVEGVKFQYHYGERGTRREDYDNLFLSGGLKYDILSNFRFQLSMSQAILRPDYGNLSGTVNYPGYYPTSLWIPNSKLKPERTTKYYAGLQWYLTPAGIVELSAYRLDITDLQVPNMQITSEQAEAQLGYSLADALRSVTEERGQIFDEETQKAVEAYEKENPIIYRSTINASGTRHVYGVTLRYDQQLTFLPGILKGLSIFGSFTTANIKHAQMEEEKIGRASKSANGGIKYRLGKLNFQLRGTWTDDRLRDITRPYPDREWVLDDHRYEKARFVVDFSGGFNLNRNLELVWSIRNLTSEPIIYYSNTPGRLARYSVPDTIWNLSLRGRY